MGREEEAAAATLAAHSEITAEAEQQAKERSRAALEATMKRNAVERERQRLSERRVREHKARVERQLAAAARKAELAKQTEAERSARQSILMRLKDAEQRYIPSFVWLRSNMLTCFRVCVGWLQHSKKLG